MKPSDAPTVYVGIVTYSSDALIAQCITSILNQRNVKVRITVLDNASTRSIAHIMRRFKHAVTFIQSETNLGFGGGHNAILRSLPLRDSDYYMAVNPDAIPEPDCIAKLARASQRHAAAWVTGKLYKHKRNKTIYSAGHALLRDGYAFNIGFGIVDHGQYNTPREVFGAPGAAALYQGSMIHALSVRGNFFDPALFMYYEDVDIDWRARARGLRCWYEPSAIVAHPGGTFPRALETEVLANRFLSVCKNALLRDLVFYNIPRICIHIIVRLVITPRVGFRILRKCIKEISVVIDARKQMKVFSESMHEWFMWSYRESSRQPISLVERLFAFVGRLLRA